MDDYQLLLLDWIEGGLKTKQFWKQFGELLAGSASNGTDLYFGFAEDNYMGALPQINTQKENWIDFFIHCRLYPQIKLAEEKKLLQTKQIAAFENLYPRLTSIFNNEKPALLHGDLWSGNFMCNETSPTSID